MPLQGVTYIEVTGHYADSGGRPRAGLVKFRPNMTLLYNFDAVTKVITPKTFIAVLNNAGTFSIQLPATDDPALAPEDWSYHVEEDFPGGRTFSMQISVDLPDLTIDLSTFVPLDLVDPGDIGSDFFIGPQGIQGIQGEQGIPGFGEPQTVFHQGSAAATWDIDHERGDYPVVVVVDSSGNVVEGHVQYIDENNVQIKFTNAFAGVAYLSA